MSVDHGVRDCPDRPWLLSIVFLVDLDDGDGNAERRFLSHRWRVRNRNRHAFAGVGPLLLWVIGGVLYLAAGVFCIVNPLMASIVLTLMLGADLVAAGAIRVCLATQLPAGQPRILVFLAALRS